MMDQPCFASTPISTLPFVLNHIHYIFIVKLGFQMNASSWPMFLLRTLNGAEMAPAIFFKKVRSLVAEKSLVFCYLL